MGHLRELIRESFLEPQTHEFVRRILVFVRSGGNISDLQHRIDVAWGDTTGDEEADAVVQIAKEDGDTLPHVKELVAYWYGSKAVAEPQRVEKGRYEDDFDRRREFDDDEVASRIAAARGEPVPYT